MRRVRRDQTRCLGEHLPWAGHIERKKTIKGNQHDGAGWHGYVQLVGGHGRICGYVVCKDIVRLNMLAGTDELAGGIHGNLAAVLLQLHVFVTAALAALFLNERPSAWQILGSLIAFAGLGLVAMHAGSASGPTGSSLTLSGVLLMLLAATAWGSANIVSKRLGRVDLMALMAWGSLFAWPPLLLASLALEGPQAIGLSLQNISGVGVGAVLYMAYFGTFLAYALWSKLLYLYPATQVAPFTPLVPVLTILSAAWVLDEPLRPWKLAAAALVLAGVLIATFGARMVQNFRRSAG